MQPSRKESLYYARFNKNLTAGFVLQNPISYAGSPNRPAVNQMLITPTFTFNLAQGWFVGMTDYNFTWNWENGGAATIPIGMQIGKVVRSGISSRAL